jgi:hypothetical protein
VFLFLFYRWYNLFCIDDIYLVISFLNEIHFLCCPTLIKMPVFVKHEQVLFKIYILADQNGLMEPFRTKSIVL